MPRQLPSHAASSKSNVFEGLVFTISSSRAWLQVDAEDLVFSLEALVDKLGPEVAPFAVQMVQQLVAAFAKYSSQADEEDDDEQCESCVCVWQ